MAWVTVAVAIVVEITGTSLLKSTDGFSRLWPSLGVLALYGTSVALLSRAVQQLEVSIVYAVWSGVGTAAIAAIGLVFLGEPLGALKALGLALVIAGVVILNLAGAH
jgi:small multidrug resistance pump